MTALVVIGCTAAVIGAIASAWSPGGESMLASITPLGERGRRSRWPITVTAFLLGATAAGVAVGAACGALGSLVVGAIGVNVRLAVLAAALAIATGLDMRARAVPGPRRQVNERWLDEYRGWVYGLGYGAQLGVGFTTVVSSAATYVAIVAALLAGEAALGAVIIGCYGLLRGLTPLASASVRSTAQLLRMHQVLERWRHPVRWGAAALLATNLLATVAWSVA